MIELHFLMMVGCSLQTLACFELFIEEGKYFLRTNLEGLDDFLSIIMIQSQDAMKIYIEWN